MPAWAIGTAAGTQIHNQVEVSFHVGDVESFIHVEQASHTFTVSEIVRSNVSALNPDGVAAATPATDVVMGFLLSNTGNGQENFLLDAQSALQSEFPVTINSIWIESNGEPGLQDSDTRYQQLSQGVSLLADESVTVYLVGEIPAELTDQAHGIVDLVATSATPGAVALEVGEALPDGGDNGIEAVITQQHASHQASGFYVVSGIKLDVQKEVLTVNDPYGGSLVMSGAEITYRILINATGRGEAKDLRISDPLPASMSYKKNSLLSGDSAITDRSDDDQGYFDEVEGVVWFTPGDITAPLLKEYQLTYVVD